jgi:hypothetical protein
MWKKSGGQIISGLVGAVITLVIFIFGFSGVVAHDDIKDFITKADVMELIPEESEYIKDQRMILSHIEATKKALDSLVEKVSDLDKTMATLVTKINDLPVHNFPNSLGQQDR